MLPANLTDTDRIAQLIKEYKPDEIYNLAAQSSVGVSFSNYFDTIGFNTLSVLNLLEAVKAQGFASRIYHASSGEMFGKAANLSVTEKTNFIH